MANIKNELKNIKNAIYGKDVRGSIHDGIDKINKETEVATGKADEAIEVTSQIIDESFDSGELDTNIKERLNDLETEYTPRLSGLEEKVDQNKEEVTSHLAENALRYEQVDFVELLKRYSHFEKMQIYKVAEPNSIEVSVINKDRHITFHFFDTNKDDYSVLNFVYTGVYNDVVQPYQDVWFNELDLTGSWVKSTEIINGYTNEVGATFETTVYVENDGDSILLKTNANNSGGMWKITIDDVEESSMMVSSYNSSSTKRSTVIGKNMKKATYKIKGEFMGDDPDNPPSSSPSRGWLNSLNNPVISIGEQFARIFKDTRLNSVSNKDFAYNIKPKGSENSNEFVPAHNARTSYFASPIVYKDGDKEIDIENMKQNSYESIESLTVEQHIYGRHPDNNKKNLVEIWTNQSITKDGLYNVDGKMKVLEPTTFNNSYVMMGVAESSIFDTILSSMGNQYPNTSDMIGESTKIPERDWAKSYVFLSSDKKDLAIAYRFNNIRETLRQGQDEKDSDPIDMTYIQHRSEDIVKIYSRLWKSADIKPGYVHKFSGDYIYSAGRNFYDVMEG